MFPELCLRYIFEECSAHDLREVMHLAPRNQARVLMRFRRAHEAHRDARLVFHAAAEGRPLELQRRLVLGKLAGGLHVKGKADGSTHTVLEVARAREHGECVRILESC